MLRRERTPGGALDALEESALTEVGNILGGAYMTALSADRILAPRLVARAIDGLFARRRAVA